MKRTALFLSAIALALPLAAAAQGQAQPQQRQQTQEQAQERIYGSQLMTDQERNEYRNRMRAATTEQERVQLRAEHHRQMQQRAKERGVTLPDDPPAQRGYQGGPGPGPGYGGGMGGGSGKGSGMGPGGRQ